MMRRTAILLTLSLILSFRFAVSGQDTSQKPEQRLSIGVAEIAVDVVVRDKQGKPVKGLTSSDFQITEDGVGQQITSSRLIVVEPPSGKPTPKDLLPGTTTTATSTDAPRMTAVAVVFDRLTPEGRARAHEAALNFVDEHMKQNSLAAVYLTDLSLRVLQPLTLDTQLVKQAIDRAGKDLPTSLTSSLEQQRDIRDQLTARNLYQSTTPANEAPADPFTSVQLASHLRVLDTFEALEAEYGGMATINGISAAIESLRAIPGRKAVLLFSEGIALPPTVEPSLRTLIASATSAHVSVYGIDAVGLRTQSVQANIGKEMQSRSNTRMSQLDTGKETIGGGPMTKELERNEQVVRSDPRSSLGDLASQTGGFLISDTNDLKTGIGKIDEDMRTYYMLTYAPKDQTADGRFRKIEVKVKHGNMSVQSRRGYYAINASYSSPVMDYETPALAIASSNNRPKDLGVKASVLQFPDAGRNGRVATLAEVPIKSVTFHTNDQTKRFSSDFSVVILFKSDSQQVVKKLSHRYAMDGPVESLEAAKKENVLFYKDVDLDPGSYRIQTVVYDAFGKKAGITENTIEVPSQGDSDLRVSSVVVIRRAERLKPAEQKEANPFHVGELLAYPNLGEPLAKTTYKQLPFFFNVYLPKGSTAAPTLAIELGQGGQTLVTMPAQLPAANPQGIAQYVGGLPLESIPPGEYELKVIVKLGSQSASRSAKFAVQ